MAKKKTTRKSRVVRKRTPTRKPQADEDYDENYEETSGSGLKDLINPVNIGLMAQLVNLGMNMIHKFFPSDEQKQEALLKQLQLNSEQLKATNLALDAEIKKNQLSNSNTPYNTPANTPFGTPRTSTNVRPRNLTINTSNLGNYTDRPNSPYISNATINKGSRTVTFSNESNVGTPASHGLGVPDIVITPDNAYKTPQETLNSSREALFNQIRNSWPDPNKQ